MKKSIILFTLIIGLGSAVFGQKQVRQTVSREELLNEEYCSQLFSTREAEYFDMLDESVNSSAQGYTNVLSWLQGRVAGLQIFYTRTNVPIPIIRNSAAAVFIDEMLVDYSTLNSLSTSDVAMIKIIKQPFIGARGNRPAVLIYTREAEEGEE